jgi:hypothetical protein
MKKIIFTIATCLLVLPVVFAQYVPQGMKYQAVARNKSGELISNQPVSLRIQLQSGSQASGNYYIEVHDVVTNEFGLFSLVVGEGKVEVGNFSTIPWNSQEVWLDIAIRTKGENTYTPISKSKLLAVPYAFHAGTAEKLTAVEEKQVDNDQKKDGVPARVWSLFGNSKINPEKDRLGTTDSADLVFISNNKERLRITAKGQLITADGVGLNLGGNLKVRGDSVNIDKDLFVGRNVYLNVDKSFSPLGETFNYGKLTSKGQVTINAPMSGTDTSFNAYPLRVQGGNQGIAVKVNGTRNSGNNFLTFWDNNGIQGRVEGQTAVEMEGSFEWIWWHEQSALETAFQIAMVAVDLIGLDDFDAAAVEGVELVDIISNWVAMPVHWKNKVGVSYESGSGDYAEWLEKANHRESFSHGDIVAVVGGKISKNMPGATRFMVISQSPIVLGNMPPAGRQNDYEKIAFMGQVPVKVRGKVNIGDYILASELNDGFGIAVNPDNMEFNQFERIVGVAWSQTESQSGFSMVNVAVGINTNDVVGKMKKQHEELQVVKNELNKITAYLQLRDTAFKAKAFEVAAVEKEVSQVRVAQHERTKTIQALNTILKNNPEFLRNILADARKILDENGVDYKRFEQTQRLVTDEHYFRSLLERFNK